MKTPQSVFSLLARLIVGSVLIYAGFMKAMGPAADFAAILEAYKLFPPSFLTPLSISLPYIEMWIGLFVFTGFYTRQAAVFSGVLAISFFVSVGSTFIRHIDLTTCGCFGPESLKPHQTMMLDVLLLILSLTIYLLNRYPLRWTLDQALE